MKKVAKPRTSEYAERPEKAPESDLIAKELQSIDKELEGLSEATVRVLKTISFYISKAALSLDESCILAGVDPKKFKEVMKHNPIIDKVITRKQLEFKKDLLLSVTKAARSGDDANALWLLERMYPDEFASSRYRKKKDDEDPLSGVIASIQGSSTNEPIVKPQNDPSTKPQNETTPLPASERPMPKILSIDDILK